MNKSVIVHLKNKYPDGKVFSSETTIDVYNASGEHVIAIRKDGNNDWHCKSEEMGLSGRFCLAPIPKDARVHKLHKDGKIGLDDLAEERKEKRKAFQCKDSGKIKSMDELQKGGEFRFDSQGYQQSK